MASLSPYILDCAVIPSGSIPFRRNTRVGIDPRIIMLAGFCKREQDFDW